MIPAVPDAAIARGRPLPLGATVLRHGINFSVFSRHASGVTLLLFAPETAHPFLECALDPRYNRTGDVWHVFIRDLDPGIEYGYRVDGPNDGRFHRYDRHRILLDPYARALSGGRVWGGRNAQDVRRSMVIDQDFDWARNYPLNTHLADTVIYELHVRGFTRHASSDVSHPGTFAGVIERIPYLKTLGVTAVELMPVTEFDENGLKRINPVTGAPLCNFWGYDPISFFAPKASYASDKTPAGPAHEFKRMVKALHEAGIEVILDMVFNHTGEWDGTGPTVNLRGLDNAIYYLLDPETGAYIDYSGCRNTVNCNHPVVRSLIMDALRYWVTEMHVDGFRFDLASILGRGQSGEVMANPPLLERIAAEPVLANTKLIAEAWDAAGLYQVGTFPNWGRWAEWNGKFRDDVRRFVRGDPGMVPVLATRMAGSSDLYQDDGRAPYHSVNFITSHDGFTLADLVSYEQKHNEPNGLDNEDGFSDNLSWNGGVEGPTNDPDILRLRRRQMKNMAAILLVSQGVPMILYGDEMGRTQNGNNNAFCQDNETSWVDWTLLETNRDLFRFFRLLIAFRKAHPILRRRTFFAPHAVPTITWHGMRQNQPDWSWASRSIGMHLVAGAEDADLYVIAHAGAEEQAFELPPLPATAGWFRVVDTGLASPHDVADAGEEVCLADQDRYAVQARSVVVLIRKRLPAERGTRPPHRIPLTSGRS
jgi:glycogen operon protein